MGIVKLYTVSVVAALFTVSISHSPVFTKPWIRCEGHLQVCIRITPSGVLLEEHCKNGCWRCRRWLEPGHQLSITTTGRRRRGILPMEVSKVWGEVRESS